MNYWFTEVTLYTPDNSQKYYKIGAEHLGYVKSIELNGDDIIVEKHDRTSLTFSGMPFELKKEPKPNKGGLDKLALMSYLQDGPLPTRKQGELDLQYKVADDADTV